MCLPRKCATPCATASIWSSQRRPGRSQTTPCTRSPPPLPASLWQRSRKTIPQATSIAWLARFGRGMARAPRSSATQSASAAVATRTASATRSTKGLSRLSHPTRPSRTTLGRASILASCAPGLWPPWSWSRVSWTQTVCLSTPLDPTDLPSAPGASLKPNASMKLRTSYCPRQALAKPTWFRSGVPETAALSLWLRAPAARTSLPGSVPSTLAEHRWLLRNTLNKDSLPVTPLQPPRACRWVPAKLLWLASIAPSCTTCPVRPCRLQMQTRSGSICATWTPRPATFCVRRS